MSIQVLMPKLGFSMDEGVLAEWLVSDGTTVKQGQPLYTLESDKALEEIEASATGQLKIIATPGKYSVGTLLAEIIDIA